MQVYCEKCREPQKENERRCSKCGAPYGGELWVLIMGIVMAFFIPVIMVISGKDLKELLNAKFFFWYEFPLLIGIIFLYDHNPKRRSIYFWGGSAIIVGSLYALLS